MKTTLRPCFSSHILAGKVDKPAGFQLTKKTPTNLAVCKVPTQIRIASLRSTLNSPRVPRRHPIQIFPKFLSPSYHTLTPLGPFLRLQSRRPIHRQHDCRYTTAY